FRRGCFNGGRQFFSQFVYRSFRFADPAFSRSAERFNFSGDSSSVIWNLSRQTDRLIENEPSQPRQKSGYQKNHDDDWPRPAQMCSLQKIDQWSQKESEKNCQSDRNQHRPGKIKSSNAYHSRYHRRETRRISGCSSRHKMNRSFENANYI